MLLKLLCSLNYFPTRLTQKRGTLIDNFLVKLGNASTNCTSGILLNCLFDHCPYFMILDRFKLCHHLQKTVIVTPNYDNALIQFKEKLHELCLIDNFDCRNNANQTENYNKFSAMVTGTISHCFQQKILNLRNINTGNQNG